MDAKATSCPLVVVASLVAYLAFFVEITFDGILTKFDYSNYVFSWRGHFKWLREASLLV